MQCGREDKPLSPMWPFSYKEGNEAVGIGAMLLSLDRDKSYWADPLSFGDAEELIFLPVYSHKVYLCR